MKAPYFQVDSFTADLFAGNPAGVCLLDRWPSDAILQSVAFENGLSETAFVVRVGEEFELRWFTPSVEVDLCGHATLAAAHVLVRHCGLAAPLSFHTKSGLLTVADENGRLVLDFPSWPGEEIDPPPGLVDGLGLVPEKVLRGRDLVAVFGSADLVRGIAPAFDVLTSLDCLGVIVTAPGDDCDFVSRFFAPRVGVPEDAVTGSAHCALTPYWVQRLGRTRLHARQISRRGGELWCELVGDRVRIGGQAVTYSEGTISLPQE